MKFKIRLCQLNIYIFILYIIHTGWKSQLYLRNYKHSYCNSNLLMSHRQLYLRNYKHSYCNSYLLMSHRSHSLYTAYILLLQTLFAAATMVLQHKFVWRHINPLYTEYTIKLLLQKLLAAATILLQVQNANLCDVTGIHDTRLDKFTDGRRFVQIIIAKIRSSGDCYFVSPQSSAWQQKCRSSYATYSSDVTCYAFVWRHMLRVIVTSYATRPSDVICCSDRKVLALSGAAENIILITIQMGHFYIWQK